MEISNELLMNALKLIAHCDDDEYVGEDDGQECFRRLRFAVNTAKAALNQVSGIESPKFQLGDHVTKIKGSEWSGKVVGVYSTDLTPEGYCIESDSHKGSVQIYPAVSLKKVSNKPQR